MDKCLEYALKYQAKGYSVIPVSQEKRSLIKWEYYQKNKATEKEIKSWWRKNPNANVGIVTGEISNLFVVDTDTEIASNVIQESIPENLIVPCQKTPSGGMHFFFSHITGFQNKARVAEGTDIRTTGGYIVVCPSVNGNGRFWEWLEGLSILESDPPSLPDAVASILIDNASISIKNLLLYKEGDDKSRQVSSLTSNVFMDGKQDEDLFHLANHLVWGGMQKEEIYNYLIYISKTLKPDFNEKVVRWKIESALKRAEKRDLNLASEVREWVLSSSAVFLSSEVAKCLHLSSREDEKNLSKILQRIEKEGLIEKYGNRRGMYRIIEGEVKEMDFENCDNSSLDILFPFELDKFYLPLPKNIIVVTGSPDAGKTAFCLNFCSMNMYTHKINYFSSEMGELELKTRLKKFPFELNKWKSVRFIERSNNFSDVIEPDELNVVDYIPMPEEPWKIVMPIRQIFDKLNKGICVIALQRPRDRVIARGGEGTLDIARLYVSMGNQKISIEKCKNWKNDLINPNKLVRGYKIIQGCKIQYLTEWEKGGIDGSQMPRL